MKGINHKNEHPQIKRLNELLELKGISKAEMARMIDVSPQTVNNWFARGAISKSSALKLSETLGVSVAWILGENVEENSGLAPDEIELLNLYRQLPGPEQRNMLAVFGARLKELDEFVENYVRRRAKGIE
ncbi:Helix-turn-helix domain-containing protein [Enterobacterales bacterium 8AC]|nr:Helix-turn-helix domain-containing protein [Enterobacterales bacterium 8AC]